MSESAIVLAAFLCVGVCFARGGEEARPNFSGTWKLSQPESRVPGFSLGVTGDFLTEIVHRDPELRITTKVRRGGQYVPAREQVYYADGRGEVNGDPSKTRWRGKKLVSEISGKDTGITRELSDDGNKLTETRVVKTRVTLRMMGAERTRVNKSEIKLVYIRVAGNS